MISKTVELQQRRNSDKVLLAMGRRRSTYKVTTIRFLGIPVWRFSELLFA